MIKAAFHKIINRKTIGTLLMLVSFCLCLIFVCVIRYKGTFLSDKRKEFIANAKTVKGSYYTIDFKQLDTYSLAEFPGKGILNGHVPRRRVVQGLRTAKIDGENYIEVGYGGLTGWMKTEKVIKISEENVACQKGTLIYVDVSEVQKANLYETHAWKKQALAENIPYGTEMTLLATNSGWGKVKYDNQTGWINLAFTSIYIPGRWKVQPMDPEAKNILMQADYKVESKGLAKIPLGEVFTIDNFKNGFGRVTYKKKEGWISMHDLILQME